jgi:hypothetical protein
MRLYATVLHLHMSPLSEPLGPVYECCGSRAGITNAAQVDKIAWKVQQSMEQCTDSHCYKRQPGMPRPDMDFGQAS